jgi:hypothetical protein
MYRGGDALPIVLCVTKNFAHAILSGYKRSLKALTLTAFATSADADVPWRSATRIANG